MPPCYHCLLHCARACCDMSHELQTPLWAWGTDRTATVQHAASTAMGPEAHQTAQSHSRKTFYPMCSTSQSWRGTDGAGWLEKASKWLCTACEPLSLQCLCFTPAGFLLPTCPLHACQPCFPSPGVPRCSPSQLLGFVWWTRLLHQIHPSPLFTTTPLSDYKSSLSSYNVISNSDSHPFLSPSGRGF